MFKAGIGLGTMLLHYTVHHLKALLYSVSMRDKISHLPARWRLLLGFWLTDELFAICSGQSQQEFNRWYARVWAAVFIWFGTSRGFVGIVAGSQIPSLNEIGLDFRGSRDVYRVGFSFNTNTLPVVVCVVVSLVTGYHVG
ncbi:AzlC family ABC transporter permease [Vibrio chagasii]|nr:AzlC family ABC transporter permease [Vibrio chagasii]